MGTTQLIRMGEESSKLHIIRFNHLWDGADGAKPKTSPWEVRILLWE